MRTRARSIAFLPLAFSLVAACQGGRSTPAGADAPVTSPASTASAGQAAAPTPADYFDVETTGLRTGGVRTISIQTPKGPFNVWTKRFGKGRIKVLFLHGGPASTHEYFECAESYFPREGIEFYEYDQLGSHYSDQPTDDALWQVDRFVDEVEQVRRALGLEQFYLLGHSWGGILAIEYALAHQQHLKGLIISNMMASAPDYQAYNENVLQKQMPPAELAAVKALERAGKTADPEYEKQLEPFYDAHLLRLKPMPDPVVRAFKHINTKVYTLMQGPSEFGISGRLERWDRKPDLPKISVPTLSVGAAHDTMDPAHMKWMATQVQQGASLHCPNGSHLSMWDDQETWFRGVIGFLKAVDAGTFRKAMVF
jgi:proline iminopeptidase